ncbi:MAG: PHP domain-containing protein [Chloroflexi bacterium]|nr:PHP domain-containing protein [Chloroflexota bacterium]
MIKADLHMHTRFSQDCTVSPEALIEACRRRGLGTVAVTDHNTIAGGLAVRKIAPFPVIVGAEIKTNQGEIIGLFLEEEIPRGLSPEETIRRIRQQGGLVGVPHPFDRLRRSAIRREALWDILDQIDYLETLNARMVFSADNQMAFELARRRGLPMSSGSDAHTLFEYGRAYVEMPPFNGRDDFLEALRQGRVQGRPSPPLVHLVSSWNKLRRKLAG